MKKDFSICVVVHDNLNDLKIFLESVLECSGYLSQYEIILVENGIKEDIHDYLEKQKSNLKDTLKVITNEKNIGIGYGMYQSMKNASTKYIFRVDPDIEVVKDWTFNMLNTYNSFKEIGAVGSNFTGLRTFWNKKYIETDRITSYCMLISKNSIDKIQESFNKNSEDIILKIKNKLNNGIFDYEEQEYHLENIIKYFQDYLGYWDPGYFYGVDDFDYSLLLRYSGMHLAICPIRIKHRGASHDNKTKRHEKVFKGFQYYREKWSYIFNCFDSKYWDKTLWNELPINKDYISYAIDNGANFDILRSYI